jgi:hypothetical protein
MMQGDLSLSEKAAQPHNPKPKPIFPTKQGLTIIAYIKFVVRLAAKICVQRQYIQFIRYTCNVGYICSIHICAVVLTVGTCLEGKKFARASRTQKKKLTRVRFNHVPGSPVLKHSEYTLFFVFIHSNVYQLFEEKK